MSHVQHSLLWCFYGLNIGPFSALRISTKHKGDGCRCLHARYCKDFGVIMVVVKDACIAQSNIKLIAIKYGVVASIDELAVDA